MRSLTVSAFGHIDVWINCAAVLSFGRFEDIPAETFRHVVEINILGCANGARVALTQFKIQGQRGTLINVGSLLGVMGEPFVSPYVTTKFAIRGLTACLRQETKDQPGINVCAVLPWAIDTPIYQKAANVAGNSSDADPISHCVYAATLISEFSFPADRKRVLGDRQFVAFRCWTSYGGSGRSSRSNRHFE